MDEHDELLNLKQAAARLGVHYRTVYRYVRQGRLDAVRVGTTWRVDRSELDHFATTRAQAPFPTGRFDGSSARRWQDRLGPALRDGDEVAAWAVLDATFASGHDLAFCLLDVIGPTLGRISATADAGNAPADAAIAATLASRLVARLGARARRPGRTRGDVVIGGPPGEHHRLPLAIVANLVRHAGYRVVEVGTDAEPAVFADAVRRSARLVAVGIGATSVERLDALRAVIAAVRAADAGVPIVAGGQAIRNDEVARLLGATDWAPDGREAVNRIVSQAEHRRSQLAVPRTRG